MSFLVKCLTISIRPFALNIESISVNFYIEKSNYNRLKKDFMHHKK